MATFKEKKLTTAIACALAASSIFILFFVAPSSAVVIGSFIFLMTSASYVLSHIFFSMKTTGTIAIFVLLFLSLSWLIGYNAVNTLLLISLLMIIRFLIE